MANCISGTCHCFLGFLGPDCGRGESPAHPVACGVPTLSQGQKFPGQLPPLARRAPRGRAGGALRRSAEPCPSHVIQARMPGEVRREGRVHRTPVSIVEKQEGVATGSFAKADFPLEDQSVLAAVFDVHLQRTWFVSGLGEGLSCCSVDVLLQHKRGIGRDHRGEGLKARLLPRDPMLPPLQACA